MYARLSRTIPAVLVVAVASCAAPAKEEPAAPPPITQQSVEESVQATVAALNAGDAAKVGQSFTDDAVFINARGKYDSAAGITAFWTEALKTPGAGKDLKLEIVKWGASGDMAYSVSRFTGGVTAPTGYVVAVSQRQPDGSMKTVAQVSIPDPPVKK
ncbi:MAG: nuclear transport factor 2 family protein [Gemmatimonadetes bacterium]|nr:nuclear transport factor 2 family protein [Gemmatimonadota bacterium]